MKASPIVVALNVTALACGALLLVAVFRDPWTVDLGPFALEMGSFGPVVAASGALAILYALVYRRALRAWFGRLATGESDASDARAGRIALGALIATGLVLRIARIHEYGFNPDEAQFVYFGAADRLATVWSMVVNGSPHPPANFAMLHFLSKVSWNPLWLRLPSVLGGTFLIFLAHRFGRSLFGPAAGMAMAVLVTFSPGMLELSRVCRNYAPGFVFLLLSIHLMVRYLRTSRRRPLAAFAVVAPLAGVWHYVFVIAFLALGLVVAVELLLRRRPWRAWLAVALAHLPFAVTMGFFYLVHVSQMSPDLVETHQSYYESMLFASSAEFTRPFQGAWGYLEKPPFDGIFFGLSVLGAFCLLVNRERLALLVCVTPLVVAYGFSWAGLIPLGGTRHSSYLFPFLFGLVASQIPELLDGYRRTASNLRRTLGRVTSGRAASAPDREATRPARRRALAAPALGTAAVAISGAAFVGASLLHYGMEGTYKPFDPRLAGRELPTWYRLEDVERGFALIEERVGEHDLVVLPAQGALAARMHYHLTPSERKRKRLRERTQAVHKDTVNGVTYYDAHGPMIVSFATLLEAVERVRSFYGLPEPERVWTVQGSWEFSLSREFRHRFPGLSFDADVTRASNGLVFAIDMKSLRAVVAEVKAAESEEEKR